MIELKSGSIINDRYTIVKKHGKGTLGTEVFLGHDNKNDTDVIIRVVPPALLNDEETVVRFIQSAELAKKLKHPNILPVLDAGEGDEILYLITANEKGFFLDDYLEHRGSLDEKESIRLIKALSDALNYAWREQQIIHRNISPDTIYVCKGNVPMLTDFELAKSLVKNSHLTLEGFTVGNPYYMSPEQAQGKEVDFRSDIYCIGLVFYQLLAGCTPFADKSKVEVLRAQVTEKHASVKSKNSDITDACETVLDKMLEKDIKRRYQSWDNVISDLDAILKQQPPSTLRRVSVKPTSSQYRMQAVQMSAVQMPAALKENPPETPEKSPAESQQTPAPSQKKEDEKTAASSAGGKKLILIIAASILIIAGLAIAVVTGQNKKTDTSDSSGLTGTESSLKDKPTTVPSKLPKETTPAVEKKPIVENVKKPEKKPVKPKPAVSVADKEKEKHYRKACINNMKKIAEALQMYANVFEGKFPEPSGVEGLEILRKRGFLEMSQVFICPSTGHFAAAPGKPITEKTCDYIYAGGLSEYSNGKTPILWSKPGNHKNYGNILYVNGEVKSFSGSNWLIHTKSPKHK